MKILIKKILKEAFGSFLSDYEKKILFSRNVKNFNQLKNLIKSIRKITKDRKYPILIDEEGGDVTRLNNIMNNNV